MSIAILISTHGSVAEYLLKTTEMILGSQNNASWVNFLPEENSEILHNKIKHQLIKLNNEIGTLFLVDIWGGTPFNIINKIIINKTNYDIISGVNVPMLTEIFMARDEKNITFDHLINIAINSGRNSIKSVKDKNLNDTNKIKNKKIFLDKINNFNNNKKNQMIINLARIDDRLIHGQVVTRWTKETKVSRIIVINDEIAKDKIRTTLLTQAAPPGVTAHVVNIEKAIRVFKNPKYSKDQVMLLFSNPTDVLRVIQSGIPITSVNVGGMSFQKDKKQIHNVVSVNKKDILAFKELNKLGIHLEIRKIISDTPLKIMDLINRLDQQNYSKGE